MQGRSFMSSGPSSHNIDAGKIGGVLGPAAGCQIIHLKPEFLKARANKLSALAIVFTRRIYGRNLYQIGREPGHFILHIFDSAKEAIF